MITYPYRQRSARRALKIPVADYAATEPQRQNYSDRSSRSGLDPPALRERVEDASYEVTLCLESDTKSRGVEIFMLRSVGIVARDSGTEYRRRDDESCIAICRGTIRKAF